MVLLSFFLYTLKRHFALQLQMHRLLDDDKMLLIVVDIKSSHHDAIEVPTFSFNAESFYKTVALAVWKLQTFVHTVPRYPSLCYFHEMLSRRISEVDSKCSREL